MTPDAPMTFIGSAWSLLPPALAIGLAIVTQRVYLSLGAGVVVGAFLVHGLAVGPSLHALFTKYLTEAFAGWDHIRLLVFTILIGAAIGMMNESGGTAGLVGRLVRHASTKIRAQVMAGLAGLVIFFDDYANILILGPTFRPVFDKLKVSRAKLAYIADSTGSADASFALVSTWIGFELGLLTDSLKAITEPALAGLSAYEVFVVSIPYRFYLHLATALIFVIAILGRDFGPMLASERAAERSPKKSRGVKIRTAHWAIAAIPIGLLIAVTFAGFITTGLANLAAKGVDPGAGFAKLRAIVAAADSYQSMLAASAVSAVAALVLAMTLGGLTGRPLARAVGKGAWVMVPPLVILVLAWALGDLCRDLKTGEYVGATFGAMTKPWMLSTVVFLIACVMSFSTGSSWNTMAVLIPVAIPLAVASVVAAHLPPDLMRHHLILTVAAVLAGAVFGDHCSIISDTTILAALASECTLVEHFRTQMPYAALAAVISVAAGTLPTSLGVSVWICLPAGLLVLIGSVRLLGTKI